MDVDKDRKRKKDKNRDDVGREGKKSRRDRSRSRSPEDSHDKDMRRKRGGSRSRSPTVKRERNDRRREEQRDAEVFKAPPERKAKDTDMLNTRTGGAYIPPARLRMMQAQITDKASIAYQRLAWEALKKSIHGHINKINVGNIGIIIKELLKENIVRGRGLLCRSVIQAQAASPTFTNVYAALVSAVNSRFPNIGELLLKRLVIQFKRGFKRNDKPTCISSASFIAHLVNQRVAHEILALELLTLLVETPTDDSVEVSIAFLKECGQKLTEVSSKGVNAIFEMLRNILHEGQLDKRVQYMIEVMFQVWKDGFKDHPALIEELELVPEEEQFTHLLMLDDATDPQDILNVFKHDEKYEENEQKYKTLSKEILGSDLESGEEDGSGESGSDESDDEEEGEQKESNVTIIDNTETNLVALRRTIYLTINSSLDFEECAHKLMKMQLKPGQEVELCHMFLDCCAEQRTYEKFYGLLAQRFCNINRIYIGPFEEIFKDSYSTAHRLDTNRLRNVSKFFAHLLFTDSISWEVLECVKLNEEDTTSSSRIYIKILFQELAEYMGLKKLNDRLKDPTLQEAFNGVFPRDNPKNTRFSINFFTSIGLGGLTDELREHLKQMPKNVPPPITQIQVSSSESSSGSSSSSSSSDSSSSDEEEEKTPRTPEVPEKEKEVERWGHDGYYDTYGPDARRKPRPQDEFVRPRAVTSRNDRRHGDDIRRDEGRRNERDGQYDQSTRQQDRRDNGSRNGREDRRDDSDRRDRDDESRRSQRNDRDDGRERSNKEGEPDVDRRRNRDDGRQRSNRDGESDVNRRRNRDDGRSKDDAEDMDRRDERNSDRDRRKNEERTKKSDKEDGSSRRTEEEGRGDRDRRNRESELDVNRRRNRDDGRSKDDAEEVDRRDERSPDRDRRKNEERTKKSDKEDGSSRRTEEEGRGDRDRRNRESETDKNRRRNQDDGRSKDDAEEVDRRDERNSDRDRRKNEERTKKSDKEDGSSRRTEEEGRGDRDRRNRESETDKNRRRNQDDGRSKDDVAEVDRRDERNSDRDRRKNEERTKKSDKEDGSSRRTEEEGRGDRDRRNRESELDVDRRRNRDYGRSKDDAEEVDRSGERTSDRNQRRYEERTKRTDKEDSNNRSRMEEEGRGDKRRNNRGDLSDDAEEVDRRGERNSDRDQSKKRDKEYRNRVEEKGPTDKDRSARDDSRRRQDDNVDAIGALTKSSKKDSVKHENDSDSEDDSKKKKKDRKKKKDSSSEGEKRKRKKKDKYSKDEKENIERETRRRRGKSDASDSESDDGGVPRREKVQSDEGWDIRRASSITKELPGRYWDSYKLKNK